MLTIIRSGFSFGIGIALFTIAAISIPSRGTKVSKIETLIQSIESRKARDQVELQAIARDIRDGLQEFEDIKEQLFMQQKSLAIETMLESNEERKSRLTFDEQLQAINEQIPSAEMGLREQEQKTYLYTAAPEGSDVMIELNKELDKKQAYLMALKNQYLSLIISQKQFAESLSYAKNTFMRNWWEIENYLENNYISIRDYLDDKRKQYENLNSKIQLENVQTSKLRTQLKLIR